LWQGNVILSIQLQIAPSHEDVAAFNLVIPAVASYLNETQQALKATGRANAEASVWWRHGNWQEENGAIKVEA
jgi:hypothetical protein